jgi:hypothetical protein
MTRRTISILTVAISIMVGLQASPAREKPGPGVGKTMRLKPLMPPQESIEFIHELADRTGRIGVIDELNGETIQFVGFVKVARSHEPDGHGLVLEEGQALAVFRVPLELPEEVKGLPLRRPMKGKRRGPRVMPLLTGEEAEEGGFNLLALHNAEIGSTSFFIVRPMGDEEASGHAQKSESADGALGEQDQQDLQAIQDMQDQDAMDNMYMDQAGTPGGDNQDGGGDTGGSTNDGDTGSGGDTGGGGDCGGGGGDTGGGGSE